jgi:hypothetical protein
MIVHDIPSENLSAFFALYVAFTLFDSTTPLFPFVSKNFLEKELEALNDKKTFPFSLRIILSAFTGFILTLAAWRTTGIPENRPRDATNTLTLNSQGHN